MGFTVINDDLELASHGYIPTSSFSIGYGLVQKTCRSFINLSFSSSFIYVLMREYRIEEYLVCAHIVIIIPWSLWIKVFKGLLGGKKERRGAKFVLLLSSSSIDEVLHCPQDSFIYLLCGGKEEDDTISHARLGW